MENSRKGYIPVMDKYRGHIMATVCSATLQDVADAVVAARHAADAGPSPCQERYRILMEAARILGARHEQVALSIAQEAGKPIRDARVAGWTSRFLPGTLDCRKGRVVPGALFGLIFVVESPMDDRMDVRWIQRLSSFSKALGQLKKFIDKGNLNELEEQGLIQAFEYTYELAWNTLKDYFEHQGESDIHGSRDAIRLAFRRGLVEEGHTWMEMIKSRTLTTHTYNEETAHQIAVAVVGKYYPEFVKLYDRMHHMKDQS